MWPFYKRTLTVLKIALNLDSYIRRMWNIADLLEDVSSGGEAFRDICIDLQRAFDAAKDTLKKWTNKMFKCDLYFTAHVLNPRYKFSLLRAQYGEDVKDLILRIKTWFKDNYPYTATFVVAALLNQGERPSHIDQHKWLLLQRARELNAVPNQADLITDFDRYFNDLVVVDWDLSVEDFNLKW